MGKVKVEDLRRVLDLYCFRLTHDQWRKVKAGLSIGPDNCVDYATFLKLYVGPEVSNEGYFLMSHFSFCPLFF